MDFTCFSFSPPKDKPLLAITGTPRTGANHTAFAGPVLKQNAIRQIWLRVHIFLRRLSSPGYHYYYLQREDGVLLLGTTFTAQFWFCFLNTRHWGRFISCFSNRG